MGRHRRIGGPASQAGQTNDDASVVRSDVELRVAGPRDDAVVRRLFKELHNFNAGLDSAFSLVDGWEDVLDQCLASWRASGEGCTLLAWRETRPLGLLMMQDRLDSPLFRHRRWIELLALYVVPEARRAGVAHRLLLDGLEWARSRGHERLRLYVTASNHQARDFYARSGFQLIQEIWRLDL